MVVVVVVVVVVVMILAAAVAAGPDAGPEEDCEGWKQGLWKKSSESWEEPAQEKQKSTPQELPAGEVVVMDHQQEAPAATSSNSASSSVECVRKN